MPVLITAGSLVGFVAFAGGVIVWTRFSAANVPADQAVNVIPRDELVSTGASPLLLFGFFAAMALIAVFLIDRGGRATPGMSRGLLLILMAEGVAVILAVEQGLPLERRIAAAEVFVLLVGVALWATHVGSLVEFEDDLPNRKRKNGEEPKSEEDTGLFRLANKETPFERDQMLGAFAVALWIGAVAAGIAMSVCGWSTWVVVLTGVGAVGVALLVIVAYVWATHDSRVDRLDNDKEESKENGDTKPMRLELASPGKMLVVPAIALAAVGPSLIMWQWWVAASLAAATILVAGLWRVAYLSDATFLWYGLAVFISVPLLGTVTWMVRNLADPQVQPMAMIRETDGPDEAIQGLYVTETSNRVYFANVGTEGCHGTVSSDSGRLLWVPESEVVAMSIGPLQDLDDAAESALEMSYALTPAVETPAGNHVTLTVAEKRSKTSEARRVEPDDGQRLENAGPAVRPDFGSGLSLTPETASPGDTVTLKMNTPDPDVEGFGASRSGHTLRLNGVSLSILREPVLSPFEGEFVETLSGMVLPLDKEGIHRKEGDRYIALEPGSVEAVDDGNPETGELWLPLNGPLLAPKETDAENLAPEEKRPAVMMSGGERLPLRYGLQRQSWDEDEIKFRVPANGASGVVTVECGQLAGQPLLRVAEEPTARISVHMLAGSEKVLFNSRRSSADDEIVSRSWQIEGAPESHGVQAVADLKPRLGAYSVRLTVTAANKETDTAELHLLRLPASSFAFGNDQPLHPEQVERARHTLAEAVQDAPPEAIELDGHADDVGTPSYNLGLSLARARHMREALLSPSVDVAKAAKRNVPVTTLAYGETCPADRRGGRRARNRRVDVFVLGQDVTVVPAPGCHPERNETTSWMLRPASSDR